MPSVSEATALAENRAVETAAGNGGEALASLRKWELPLAAFLALALLLPNLWGYSLIDPWEGHYGEVGRRILEEDDWVKLRWQNQVFRSKPVLTFWLMAASMKLHGVAGDGGYSGEMVASELPIWALRLPFALFGAFGLIMVWLMLRRLVSRRVAWLGFGILGTTPFYFFVARQAITDIPMIATAMGAICCVMLAMHDGDRPLRPIWGRINALHIFLAVLGAFVLWQAVYHFQYFWYDRSVGRGVKVMWPWLTLSLPFVVGLIAVAVLTLLVWPARATRDVYMLWAYLLAAVSVLAKGPPGMAIVGVTVVLYLLMTGNWRFVLRARVPEGILVIALVAVPWHLAMAVRDGRAFVNEYFGHHWFKRASEGVHGDTGTFLYFVQQIGIGMWPWVGLLPAAAAHALGAIGRPRTLRDHVRLLAALWGLGGFVLFTLIQTKFHHYVLPAVPGLVILLALWIDDVLDGRVRKLTAALAVAIAITLLVMLDLASEQKQLIELYIYRYDRAWPSASPWKVDLAAHLWVFGLAFAALLAAACVRQVRRYAAIGFAVAAVVYAYWGMNYYMEQAAPHWGQRQLHVEYFKRRQIHGVDLQYYGLRDLADDWGSGGREYEVRSVLPDGLAVGQPMKVTVEAVGVATHVLNGRVARLGDDRFWIEVPDAEVAKLASLVDQGRAQRPSGRRPWKMVNADRMIAWQLNWRGENFWQGGEIWGRTPDTQTVYEHTDNKAFLEYLKPPERQNRTYYVITESQRATGLKSVLPTQRAKDTVEILDTSCNKFTLLRFTL